MFLNKLKKFGAKKYFISALTLSSAFYSLKYNETESEPLVNTLTHLVRFRTLTGHQLECKELLDWVSRQFRDLPVYIDRFESNGFPIQIITTQPHKSPKIWLVCHIDVVPGSDSLFDPQMLENSNLQGRGVYDMKMALACYIHIFKSLGDDLKNYDIGILLTSDEEIGGMNGCGYCFRELKIGGGIALIPDGGFNWNIETAAKGIVQLILKSDKSMSNFLYCLKDFNTYFEKKRAMQDKKYFSTYNIGTIAGEHDLSLDENPKVKSMIDVRIVPTENMDKVVDDLQSITKKFDGVELKKLITGDSHSVDTNDSRIQMFRKIAKDLYDIDVGYVKSHGASDARFFGNHGIPTLVVSPTGGNIHSETEWINIPDYVRFYNVISDWTIKLGKI
eukprot:gene6658-10823_t